jgi:hypothetical protein
MKRDMELVRKILLAMEAEPSGSGPMYPQIEPYDLDMICHHIFIMGTGGLIEMSAEAPKSDGAVRRASALNLRWAGYEFLDASRDEGVWQEAKKRTSTLGGAVTIAVMVEVLKDIALRKLGLRTDC